MNAVPHDPPDGLAEEDSETAELSNLLAFMAPEPFPEKVLLEQGEQLPAKLKEAIAAVDGEMPVLPVETATEVRERMGEDERRHWCALGLRILRDSFPDDAGNCLNWEACADLLPHLIAVVDHAEALGISDASSSWLLDRAAVYQYGRGEYAAATDLSTRAMAQADLPAGDPLLGDLHRTLGSLLVESGELDEGRREIERALEIHESLGASDVDVRADRICLAEVLSEQGDRVAAREQLDLALADRGEEEADRWDGAARRALAWVLNEEGKLDEARSAYETALELEEKVQGPEHPDTANARTGLGVVLGSLSLYEEARVELERAQDISEAALGPRHPEIAVIRSNLGGILQGLNDLQGARAHLAFALEMGEELLPEDHRGLWIRHRKLASVLQYLGELKEARSHAEEALAISERTVGPEDARVEGDLELVASICRGLGEMEAARDAYLGARAIAERERGGEHLDVAKYDEYLGQVYRELGGLVPSRGHFERALQIYEADEEGDSHASLVRVRLALAQLLAELGDQLVAVGAALGRDKESKRLRKQSKAAFVDALSGELEGADVTTLVAVADVSRERAPDFAANTLSRAQSELGEEGEDESRLRQRVGASWHRLGRALRDDQSLEPAVAAFRAAVPLLEGNPLFQGIVLHDIAEVLRAAGRVDEAIECFRDAAEYKRAGGGASSPRDLGTTLQALGRTLEADKRYEDALGAYREALEVWQSLPDPDPRAVATIVHDLADVQRSLGNPEDAIALYRESLQLQREAGADSHSFGATLLWLGRAQASVDEFEGALDAFREWLEALRAWSQPDPQAEGVVLHDIGDVLQAEGKLDQAIEIYREAAERKGRGDKRRDQAITLHVLGRVLARVGDYGEALAVYAEQLEVLRALPEPDPHMEGTLLHDIADSRWARGERDQAIELYREAAHRKRDANLNLTSLVATLQALGRALEQTGDYKAAIDAHNEQLKVMRSLPEPDLRMEGVALHDIGDTWRAGGETKKAVESFREAADRKRKAGDLRSLALSLEALGRTLEQDAEYEKALVALEEALDALRRLPAPEPAIESTILHDIADVRRKEGKLDEAIGLYREAVERRRAEKDGDRFHLVAPIQALGRALDKSGDYEAAIAAFEEQLEVLRGLSSPQLQLEGVALHDIAQARSGLGELDEAIRLYREALDRKREAGDPAHRKSIASTLQALARALEKDGAYEAALTTYGEQLEILRSLDPDPQLEGVALHDMGDVQEALGNNKEAVEHYREAVQSKRAASDSSAGDLATTLIAQSSAELALEGDAGQRAGETADEALELVRGEPDPDPELLASVLVLRGEIVSAEDQRQALAFFGEAREVLDASPESDPLERASVRAMAVTAHEALDEADEAAAERTALIAILNDTIAAGLERYGGEILSNICILCVENGGLDLARVVIEHLRARIEEAADSAALTSILAGALGYLGRALERNHEYKPALETYREQLETLRSLPQAEPRREGVVLHDLGDVRLAQREADDARGYYEQAVEHKRAAGEQTASRSLVVSLLALGLIQLDAKDVEAAGSAGEEALGLLRGEDHPDSGLLASALALCAVRARQNSDPERALELLEEANAVMGEAPAAYRFDAGAIKGLLADAYADLGREEEASAVRKEIEAA